MGRCVYDHKGEFVWKYVFAEQSSEQCRIAQDYAIGKYHDRSQNVSPRRQSGDLLTLSRKDIERLANTIKPIRRQIATFMMQERRVFAPNGLASMNEARNFYRNSKQQNPNILFHVMCNRFVKRGKKFFNSYPKSKVMNCYGE